MQQLWRGLRSSVRPAQSPPRGASPTPLPESPQLHLQLDTAAGAVVPAGPLHQIIIDGVVGLSRGKLNNLGSDRGLLRRVDEFVQGVQVGG